MAHEEQDHCAPFRFDVTARTVLLESVAWFEVPGRIAFTIGCNQMRCMVLRFVLVCLPVLVLEVTGKLENEDEPFPRSHHFNHTPHHQSSGRIQAVRTCWHGTCGKGFQNPYRPT